MEFTASSVDLLNHLQNTSRVINSQNTLPILDNFWLKVEGNQLKIAATDLENTITTQMEIQDVNGEGAVTIRAKILLDTLKGFTADQPLVFNIDNENLAIKIKSETDNFEFNGDAADQFPELPEIGNEHHELIINSEKMMMYMAKSAFAASTKQDRPVMTGIYFDISEEMLTLAATDAHRLVRLTDPTIKSDSQCSFILPKKPTQLLMGVLPKEEDVEITFDEKNIQFKMKGYTIIARQIAGKYPNYNAVIPTDCNNELIVKKDAFLSALKKISTFANPASNQINLDIKSDHIILKAQDLNTLIKGQSEIPCQYTGEEMVTSYKGSFLEEMVSKINADEVQFKIKDPMKPALFFPYGDKEDYEQLMLIMPLVM